MRSFASRTTPDPARNIAAKIPACLKNSAFRSSSVSIVGNGRNITKIK
jgi:hypothetical protein